MTYQILIDSTDITESVEAFDITHNEGFCYTISVKIAGVSLFAAVDPLTDRGELRIHIIIDAAEDYESMLEERTLSIDNSGNISIEIWGRSSQARLAAPYSPAIIDTASTIGDHPWQLPTEPAYADYDILDYIGGTYNPYGVTLDWQIPDFYIFMGCISAVNQTPIDIISKLADAAGAELYADYAGDLVIRTYSVTAASASAAYTDADDIITLSTREIPAAGYNAVVIYGHPKMNDPGEPFFPDDPESASGAPFLLAVLLTDTDIFPLDNFIVRLYWYHPDPETSPQFASDSDVSVLSDSPGTESISEDITLKWGAGNISKCLENGLTEYFDPGSTGIPILKTTVSYIAPYTDFTLSADTPGTKKNLFYFSETPGTIQTEFEVVILPEPCADCTSENIEACGAQDCCEGVSGYWYLDECHSEPMYANILCTICDADDNFPIFDAQITIDSIQDASTNEDGQSAISDICFGDRDFSISAAGYTSLNQTITIEQLNAVLFFKLTQDSAAWTEHFIGSNNICWSHTWEITKTTDFLSDESYDFGHGIYSDTGAGGTGADYAMRDSAYPQTATYDCGDPIPDGLHITQSHLFFSGSLPMPDLMTQDQDYSPHQKIRYDYISHNMECAVTGTFTHLKIRCQCNIAAIDGIIMAIQPHYESYNPYNDDVFEWESEWTHDDWHYKYEPTEDYILYPNWVQQWYNEPFHWSLTETTECISGPCPNSWHPDSTACSPTTLYKFDHSVHEHTYIPDMRQLPSEIYLVVIYTSSTKRYCLATNHHPDDDLPDGYVFVGDNLNLEQTIELESDTITSISLFWVYRRGIFMNFKIDYLKLYSEA